MVYDNWQEKRAAIRRKIDTCGVGSHMSWGVIVQSINVDPRPHMDFVNYYEDIVQPFSSVESIVEAGPGIGTLAKMIFESGFKGRYTSFDFPEMQEIQRYALGGYDVEYINDVDDMPQDAGLFISSFSVEEMPQKLRECLLSKAVEYKSHLLRFNGSTSKLAPLASCVTAWQMRKNWWAR